MSEQVMRQALTALNSLPIGEFDPGCARRCTDAIAALEAALGVMK